MTQEKESFVDNCISGDFVAAEEIFKSEMREKVQSALDMRKVAVAQSMYQKSPEE